MVIFDAINIFSKGITTMAIDPNAVRAAQAGKTVITTDGYEITYDDNGFGRKSVAPDGSTKFYDALGNQTSTPWPGPTAEPEKTGDTASVETPPTTEPPTADEQRVLDANVDDGIADALANQNQVEETTPTEQDVIDAEEDPFEKARMEAAQESTNESPNEQQVIDASTDEELHVKGPADLAKEQAVNRETLKNEEAAIPNSAIVAKSAQPKSAVAASTDWRVKLSLAPGAKYLYADPSVKQGDLLYPLKGTGGVVFPYTPTIQTAYKANYDPADLTHSNYKMFFYKNSQVDDLTITGDFTAQDTTEALYMLAVIHFFKSATKMFYGKDTNPSAGTPPPLVFLSGYGQYQFSNHPMLITSFTYSLPNDVDYIRANPDFLSSQFSVNPGANTQKATRNEGLDFIKNRLFGAKLNKGGLSSQPVFPTLSTSKATYVPTKISLSISCLPIVTRNDISNNFSLAEYASGALLKKGIW